ncbi:chymotrypsin inhibitor [Diachasma alloeum]|uniref:chymotrypsin inhibitor n=1 Tax=Diachasma alloeum TaxID=454923 RepID=UPI00073847A7|nr:chymotrypsin inhibitor [Diachasma alloeum]
MTFLLQILLLIGSVALVTADTEGNVCGENEGSYICGRMCEPTCDNPQPNPRFCPRIQCTKFTESCRCHDGYLRESSGGCVSPENCHKAHQQ